MIPILPRKSRAVQVVAAALLVATVGCGKHRKDMVVSNRPIIEGASPVGGNEVVVNKPVGGSRFVERHPLLYKPGEYYSTYDGNVVVRGARATFIGVPAGMVGEVKQAFRGVPKTVIMQ